MAHKSAVAGVGERLFIARLAHEERSGERLTQVVLAGMVGVSQPTVTAWLRGDRTPTLEQVETLARVLGASPAELAFAEKCGEESPLR